MPKTLFFEYQTLTALTGYFVGTYPAQLRKKFGQAPDKGESTPEFSTQKVTVAAPNSQRARWLLRPSAVRDGGLREAIAIVGISGRYPMAENLQEFWANLQVGRDCITEIPPARWDN